MKKNLLHRYTYLDMNLQASCTENEKNIVKVCWI